jgi:uncharacterized membrane protein YkvA (DUF1232 family)
VRFVVGVLAGLLLGWLTLVAALLLARPRGGAAVREAVRLLPDLLRLVARLARDRSLPAGVRVRLVLLGAYLAVPFDLIPDFIPVLGYADDAIAVAVTLRSVARRAGVQALRRHWPGTADGFAALCRLCGLPVDGPVPPRRPSWWTDAALLAGFAALTGALAAGRLLDLDVAVAQWVEAHRPPWLYWPLRAGNLLGQGSPLAVFALCLAVLLGWRHRSVRPVLPVLAAEALTVAVILPLKLATFRAPPHNQHGVPHPERLFSDPLSQSYPSGHLAVALVWYGILGLLLAGLLGEEFARWRPWLRAVPPLVLCVTTTYLGFHWVTDTVAGLLLGVVLDRTLARVAWDTLPLGRWLAARGLAGSARLTAASEPNGAAARSR